MYIYIHTHTYIHTHIFICIYMPFFFLLPAGKSAWSARATTRTASEDDMWSERFEKRSKKRAVPGGSAVEKEEGGV
jgi:hypothetical protein